MFPDNAAAEQWFEIWRWGGLTSLVQDVILQEFQSEKTENQCHIIEGNVENISASKLALQWQYQKYHCKNGQSEYSCTRPN